MMHLLLNALGAAAQPAAMLALSLSLRLAPWIEPGWRISPQASIRDISPLR